MKRTLILMAVSTGLLVQDPPPEDWDPWDPGGDANSQAIANAINNEEPGDPNEDEPATIDHSCHQNWRIRNINDWIIQINRATFWQGTSSDDPPPLPALGNGDELTNVREWINGRLRITELFIRDGMCVLEDIETDSGLVFSPSPSWQPDPICCHDDSEGFLAATVIQGAANGAAHPNFYPKSALFNLGAPTAPGMSRAQFEADGCPPQGIGSLTVDRRTWYYIDITVTQDREDVAVEVDQEGMAQGTQTEDGGEPTVGPLYQLNQETQQGQFNFSFAYMAPLVLSRAWIHKSTTRLLYWNDIRRHDLLGLGCDAAFVTNCIPNQYELRDFGLTNQFVCP